MRPSLLSLAGCGLLVCAGCTHSTHRSPAPVTPAAIAALTPPAPRPAATNAAAIPTSRAVHLYVDTLRTGAVTASDRAVEHARTVSLSLGDLLRGHGYDVRSAEPAAPSTDAGRTSAALAAAIAAGQPAPETSRAVTYLRPNAPSLLLFVHLDETATANDKTDLVLGAFLADSASGAILWSNRVTLRPPASDAALRLLAARLVENLPARPPA